MGCDDRAGEQTHTGASVTEPKRLRSMRYHNAVLNSPETRRERAASCIRRCDRCPGCYTNEQWHRLESAPRYQKHRSSIRVDTPDARFLVPEFSLGSRHSFAGVVEMNE